jgi:hypothetical protein
MSLCREDINKISIEFFTVSAITYLLLTIAETLRPGTISNFFDLNWLLLIMVITGAAMVLTSQATAKNNVGTAKLHKNVHKTFHTKYSSNSKLFNHIRSLFGHNTR